MNTVSHKFDMEKPGQQRNLYYLHKENFMPDKNLIIKWGGKK
jgi:hypothetical protein